MDACDNIKPGYRTRDSRRRADSLFDHYRECRRQYEQARDRGESASKLDHKYQRLEKAFNRYRTYYLFHLKGRELLG